MIVRDPLDRSKVLSVPNHDMQDLIVENALSEKKEFRDMPRVAQLTQNAFNMSPFTREDNHNDVTLVNPIPIGRIERYRNKERPERYHQHEGGLLQCQTR